MPPLFRRKRDSRSALPPAEWQEACERVPLLACLPDDESRRLAGRAHDFLHRKRLTLHPALSDTPFDAAAQLALAGQACLLTLGWETHEHHEAFANVHEILVLPQGFSRQVEEMDEFGVVHEYRDLRAGETSYQGPVVISFTDLMQSGGFNGFNVLIHELAHKLDMGNSMDIDGFPPLPREISAAEWHATFTHVWEDLTGRLAYGRATPIDDYAASHPGECFAVCCEYFFSDPHTLDSAYPALYRLLTRYFNQDSLARWAAAPAQAML